MDADQAKAVLSEALEKEHVPGFREPLAAALRRMLKDGRTPSREVAVDPLVTAFLLYNREHYEHYNDNASALAAKQAALRLMRKLDGARLGRFIVGRRGAKMRFCFDPSLVEPVVQALSGLRNEDVLEEREAEQARADAGKPAQSAAREGVDALPSPGCGRPPDGAPVERAVLTHRFLVRADFLAEIALPADLAPNEARRLARFVTALPFEEHRAPAEEEARD